MNKTAHEKFYDLLNQFDTAMLASQDRQNGFHARPMQVAQVDSDGTLWFLTGWDTPKIREIDFNHQVLLTFQDKNHYVSLTGQATLVRSHEKVADLWREAFKVWFPQGKDDPNLALIRVTPEYGEYWDNAGMQQASYLFETARAYFSGTTPEIHEPEQHAKISR